MFCSGMGFFQTYNTASKSRQAEPGRVTQKIPGRVRDQGPRGGGCRGEARVVRPFQCRGRTGVKEWPSHHRGVPNGLWSLGGGGGEVFLGGVWGGWRGEVLFWARTSSAEPKS